MGRRERIKMGMFDTIRCDYPLPVTKEMLDWDLDMQNMEFQTKDLENFMEEYIITPEGELLFIKHEREWVDDDDAFLKGYLKIINTEIVPANYHGIVYFYCYEKLGIRDGRHYVISAEYEAKFVDNKLVNLELFDQEIIDETEYVHEIQEREKEHKIRAKKWYNRYIFHTRPYGTFKNIICKLLYKLHTLTGKLHMLAVRYI